MNTDLDTTLNKIFGDNYYHKDNERDYSKHNDLIHSMKVVNYR